jgi:hypothetical protein
MSAPHCFICTAVHDDDSSLFCAACIDALSEVLEPYPLIVDERTRAQLRGHFADRFKALQAAARTLDAQRRRPRLVVIESDDAE